MKLAKSTQVFTSVLLASVMMVGCDKKPFADEAETNANASSSAASSETSPAEQNIATNMVEEEAAIKAKAEQEKKAGEAALQQIAESLVRPVQAITVSTQSTDKSHSFNGIVKSGKESNLSFRVGGNVTNLAVNVGDYIKKGSFIAQLDDTDYHVNTAQTIASLNNVAASKQAVLANIKQAEAEMLRARSAYARAEKLYEADAIAASEFEQARAAWQAAEANVEASQLQYSSAEAQQLAAEQQVRAAENQLNYTKLTAPYTGMITQVNVDENEQVGAGQAIAVITDVRSNEIEVGVPASIIATVANGEQVDISFSNKPNSTFAGSVSEVGYSTANAQVFPVTIDLDSSPSFVRPGMAATVTFNTANNALSTITVPTTAVGEDKSGRFVYLLQQKTVVKDALKNESNNKSKPHYLVIRQPVVLGDMSSQGFQVMSGLKVGDLIAKAGLNVLQNGDEVTLFNTK